jgi:hypothetical protein
VDGLSNLIYGSIFSRDFSCESKEVQEYVALREEFVGEKSVLSRMSVSDHLKKFFFRPSEIASFSSSVFS